MSLDNIVFTTNSDNTDSPQPNSSSQLAIGMIICPITDKQTITNVKVDEHGVRAGISAVVTRANEQSSQFDLQKLLQRTTNTETSLLLDW